MQREEPFGAPLLAGIGDINELEERVHRKAAKD